MGIKNKGRCIWYDGKDVYEVAFCNEFLKEHPMKFVDWKFYNTDGAVDIQTVRKMISDKLLAEQVQKDFAKRVNALIYKDALHIEAQLECEADFERGFRLGAAFILEILNE